MFCQECGQKNNDYSLYCSNDGELLQDINVEFTLEHKEGNHCSECGSSLDYVDNFCTNCGQVRYKIADRKLKEKEDKEEIIESEKLNKNNLLGFLKTSSIGFGVIFVVSGIISLLFKSEIKRILQLEGGLEYYEIMKRGLGIPNIISLIHGFSAKVSMEAGIGDISGNQEVFKMSIGLMSFLLLPIIIFAIIGFIKDKEDKPLKIESMVFISVIYGIIISLSSLFIKVSAVDLAQLADEIIPFGGFTLEMVDLGVKTKISKLILILRSSTLSFIGLNIGVFIKNFRSKKSEEVEDLLEKDVMNSTGMLLIGIIFTILITFFVIESDIYSDFFDQDDGGFFISLIVYLGVFLQTAINTFFLSNGGVFVSNLDFQGTKLSILDLSEDALYYSVWDPDRKIFLYIGFLFIIFLFFLYGRRYKKKKDGNLLKLFIIPLYYAIFLGALAYLTSINIETTIAMMRDEIPSVFRGFTILSTFARGFIVAALGSMIGFFLTSTNNLGVDKHE